MKVSSIKTSSVFGIPFLCGVSFDKLEWQNKNDFYYQHTVTFYFMFASVSLRSPAMRVKDVLTNEDLNALQDLLQDDAYPFAPDSDLEIDMSMVTTSNVDEPHVELDSAPEVKVEPLAEIKPEKKKRGRKKKSTNSAT